MRTILAILFVALLASLMTSATPALAEESTCSITATDAFLMSDPPELKATSTRLPFGALVDVVEERTESGKAYVKVNEHGGAMQALGWTAKSNLGSVKEFDPAMKPEDAIDLDKLVGIELLMACTYNARGKYLKEKAAEIGVNGSALAAVLKVESSGHGFGNDGRTIIRFENNIFRNQWGRDHAETFDKHFKFDADVESMVKKFDEGIKPQLDAIVAFIKANNLCLNGLKANDYVMFARGYNGAGKAADYGAKIQAGVAAYKKVANGKKYAD